VRRVAVTGLGVVSALGIGVRPFWTELTAGRSGIRRISTFDVSTLTAQVAAEAPPFDPLEYLPDAKLDVLDRFSMLTLVAAHESICSAGLTAGAQDPTRVGVVIGTGAGGAGTQDIAYERYYRQQNSRMHPFTIPRMMNSAASSQLGMTYGWQGPTMCISTACAAATHAIGEAFEMIRAGRADVMIAGGGEAPICIGAMLAWMAMRVLAPANGDPSRACRPFSADRQGLVIGEGAAVVVLEEWEHAARRGATIHAELAGYGATADAGHITQPAVDAPARAITQALAQAELPPERIDYVNAHGTGTRLNDSTETLILKKAFGPHAADLAVSSTKSMHGHALGASGALEFVATVLAVERNVIPPTANYTAPDPECDLDCVPNVARDKRIGAAISNSFAFGGLNAVLAVKRV
jgi:nodulation protein E